MYSFSFIGARYALKTTIGSPHGIQNRKQSDAYIGENRFPHGCDAECAQRQHDDLHPDRQQDILPHDAVRKTSDTDRRRQTRRLVGLDHHVAVRWLRRCPKPPSPTPTSLVRESRSA